ncbi:hypothetical protein [Enterococcus gallinarum]|uniref:hypothetical protein n=1 Tax=Enterococcus gallinarum TaxID=1353 RepID=UPI00288FBF26|nr:hypothetical protein [Enterococcus gallinarum]MDT2719671.1 hypothetical protein [Enterococcus gallinarum]
MRIKKKIREYHTPIARVADKRLELTLTSETIAEKKNFYNVLFNDDRIGDIVQREFLLQEDKKPVALLKSWIPTDYLVERKHADLELLVDQSKEVASIRKEIALSWPNEIEAQQLQIIGDGQVLIEKTFFLDQDKTTIRYEEEISDPDAYLFEE